MLAIKQLSKSESGQLTEIEEQFLYLRELSDEVKFLQTRLEGLEEKFREVNALNAQSNNRDNQDRDGQDEDASKYNDASSGKQTSNQVCNVLSRLKISEPKAFNGNHNVKELENFIFDTKQYFKASGTNSKETKVTLAYMHLSDDAKLWWRSKVNDT
ncbi:uncharacterized protein E6C27_scaffold174G001170 [Cucumis melo var. makuwa]|uniref:Uncharacterized protein n=1 Tax=Cucumis melo var. makuwa TaxID=1194695 RepID=A0A5A7UB29_CUCMM|nr:uncharacterized protein E6C27_scaffold174G001170 [Cucumis melo var. makuwa]